MGRCNEYCRSVKLGRGCVEGKLGRGCVEGKLGRGAWRGNWGGGMWRGNYFDFVSITFSGMVLLLGVG